MYNSSLKNNITKECAAYCMRGIVQFLNGDISKFNEYVEKAKDIYDAKEEEVNWTNCVIKSNGKRVRAKVNMITQEVRDYEGNIIREGIKK